MKKLFLFAAAMLAAVSVSANKNVPVGASLQDSIDAATSGEVIKVQAGTFTGNFTMKEGVNVSGGWDETFQTQTDYATILDAQENGRVLNQPAAFTKLTIWSNLTIQNGKLTAAAGDGGSAGVWLNKNGRVEYCIIQNNSYTFTSGNCLGGGLGNDAVNANTDVLADHCIIRNNKATHGGGVRVRGTVQNCIIEDNGTNGVKAGPAGGVHLQGGRLVNCIVRRNNAGGDTGGVRAYGKCDVINNLIANNEAAGSVGGLGLESALSNVINNTIVGNNQVNGTGSTAGVKVTNSLNANDTYFVNNIIWGNKSNGTAEAQNVYYISRYDKTKGQRSYNAIIGQKGDDDATGTTSWMLTAENPGFVDPENGNYMLVDTCIFIDKANATYNTLTTDLAGNVRVMGKGIEPGCYEFMSPAKYVRVGDNLQAAINAVPVGTTIYVQAGTFTGNFTMKEGVNVSGGWDETFQTQTDYATILDAQENGRVLNQPAAFTKLTIWSNLTVQNGYLATQQADQGGAGVWLNKLGRVAHCLVQNNTVASTGTFVGGGVGSNSGNAEPDTLIIDCIIRNNKASHGGGVRTNGKGIVVMNSTIENNETTNNAAGGIQMHNGGLLIGCVVRGNKANGDTGGVRLSGGNIATVANCLIINNTATNQVGGLAMDGNLANIINNTIVGNKQQKAGATASLSGVKVKNDAGANGTFFCNNIIWGNITGDTIAPNGVYYISRYDKTKGQRSYNAIIGQKGDDDATGTTSLMLTAENPGFVDPANSDYRLRFDSKMLNFGINDKAQGSDLNGEERIKGSRVDLGCYELNMYTLTIAENANAIIKVGEDTLAAGEKEVGEGFTMNFTVAAAVGYKVTEVMANTTALVAAEGAYTLPAVMDNTTLTISTETDAPTALAQDEQQPIVLGVYNLLGTKVANGLDGLQKGTYILRTNLGAKKVIVE